MLTIDAHGNYYFQNGAGLTPIEPSVAQRLLNQGAEVVDWQDA